MALFKDTVALEACPAKTAESVSYAATFAVLGWIVLSNYSSLGYAEIEQTADGLASTTIVAPAAIEAPESESGALSAVPIALAAESPTSALEIGASDRDVAENVFDESAESETFLTDIAAWHANLNHPRQSLASAQVRAYSSSDWEAKPIQLSAPDDPVLKVADLRYLPLPIPKPESGLQLQFDTEAFLTDSVASDSIREITVTGSETDRLMARPDNIRRPQIPRPYRAQDAQRSLLLPPRIQALRP